jgi:hypothetical protein
MSFPKPYRIQHRDTGCWLSVDRDRDSWVSFRDIRWSTTFRCADEAKAAARTFNLSHERFRITTSTEMPVADNATNPR